MIAAIYARKSNEQNGVADESKSVSRQIQHARAYAQRKGWTVADDFIFVDDGISGAEFANRPGFVRLMNALRPKAPFHALIVSELSRLGRESLETGYAIKQLAQAGAKIFSYLEDREVLLDTATNKFLMSAVNFAAEIEREKTRQRVTDAMTHRAQRAHWLGGYVFGYDRVEEFDEPDESGRRKRRCVRLQVNPAEAEAIRRVFALCAEGFGNRRIAKRLNAEGVVAPRPKRLRHRGWAPSSIGAILERPLYRGEFVWNRRRKRDQWGQQKPERRDESQWVRVPAPDLRIVDDALWNAAQERRTASRQNYLRHTDGKLWGRPTNGVESKHLLVGMAVCGNCGAGMLARGRRYGSHRGHFYTCSAYWVRGSCTNDLEIAAEMADAAVLGAVEGELLTPSVIEAAIGKLVALAKEPTEGVEARRKRVEASIAKLDAELERLVEALAAGSASQTLSAAIRDREAQRQRLHGELKALSAAPTLRQPDVLNVQALRQLDEWRGLLGRNTALARQLLRKVLDGRLAFMPQADAADRWYEFSGRATLDAFFAGIPAIKAVVPVRGFEPRFDG